MELSSLSSDFEYISAANGVSLSTEEIIKLEILLDKLKSECKSESMRFWGKVFGVEKDYYIAESLCFKHPSFPLRKFFFCTSNTFIFSELPEIQKHHLKDFHRFNSYFIGNPDIILEKYSEKSSDVLEPHGDNFNPKILPKNLTEADRLSFFVRSVAHDTSVVPSGAYMILPNGEIRPSPSFSGLPFSSLSSLSSYVHLRPPERPENRDRALMYIGGKIQKKNTQENNIENNNNNENNNTEENIEKIPEKNTQKNIEKKTEKNTQKNIEKNAEKKTELFPSSECEFLDRLSEDKIYGSWSLHVDPYSLVSSLRSLSWPGYFGFHVAESEKFGAVYVGYGIKNEDIEFTL